MTARSLTTSLSSLISASLPTYILEYLTTASSFDFLGGRSSQYIREHYRGTFMNVGGLTPDTAAAGIESGAFDLAAIGRLFIANPDFVKRVQDNQPLVTYKPEMLAELV